MIDEDASSRLTRHAPCPMEPLWRPTLQSLAPFFANLIGPPASVHQPAIPRPGATLAVSPTIPNQSRWGILCTHAGRANFTDTADPGPLDPRRGKGPRCVRQRLTRSRQLRSFHCYGCDQAQQMRLYARRRRLLTPVPRMAYMQAVPIRGEGTI